MQGQLEQIDWCPRCPQWSAGVFIYIFDETTHDQHTLSPTSSRLRIPVRTLLLLRTPNLGVFSRRICQTIWHHYPPSTPPAMHGRTPSSPVRWRQRRFNKHRCRMHSLQSNSASYATRAKSREIPCAGEETKYKRNMAHASGRGKAGALLGWVTAYAAQLDRQGSVLDTTKDLFPA